jgi:hypothetical protein
MEDTGHAALRREKNCKRNKRRKCVECATPDVHAVPDGTPQSGDPLDDHESTGGFWMEDWHLAARRRERNRKRNKRRKCAESSTEKAQFLDDEACGGHDRKFGVGPEMRSRISLLQGGTLIATYIRAATVQQMLLRTTRQMKALRMVRICLAPRLQEA